jgi:hypothetical protein
MSVPRVVLLGDWPPAPEGFSQIPSSIARDWRGSLEAFGLYGYLVSLGYSQDGLSPLPDDIADAQQMPRGAMRDAWGELHSAGLLVAISVNASGDPIAEVLLPLPEDQQ